VELLGACDDGVIKVCVCVAVSPCDCGVAGSV